ncbi:MAG: endonuclease [Candidatus Omnitrophica bacterium CG11_big_fil_rev_8_21_14_0_20_43_6]|nr:MAG: endonuclease [Candidatus Omnitrophica bacterium CG11_big_fil_rev_8_21_14_0_20_43_6]
MVMKFELKKYNRGNRKSYRNVGDDELIADLRHVANKLQKDSITHREYDQRGKFNSHIFARRFGGWLSALEKAGLQKTRNYNITDEDAFQNLENIWIRLGRQPKREELVAPLSKYSGAFYEYRFNTWQKALEKFVVYINNDENSLSKEIKTLEIDPNTQHKTGRGINLQLRFIVMRRDNFKCKNCGRSPATDSSIILHVDHIKPWSKGGETVLEDLQTLCSVCNIGKSDL